MQKVTKPSDFYLPPTLEEIHRKAVEMGVEAYQRFIVEDAINLLSGGRFLSDIEIEEQYRAAGKFDKFHRTRVDCSLKSSEREDGCGGINYLVPEEPGATRLVPLTSRQQALESFHQEELYLLKQKVAFLKSAKELLGTLPGATPLEKALHFSSVSPDPDKDPSALHLSRTKNLTKSLSLINKVKPDDLELLTPSPDGTTDEQKMQLLKVLAANSAEQSVEESKLTKKLLELSSSTDVLDNKVDITSAIVKQKKPDGEYSKLVPLQDFSQIKSLAGTTHTKQTLLAKACTQELLVKQRFDVQKRKPLVSVLVDNSGSMHGGNQMIALKVVYNLLQKVVEDEIFLLFSFFEKECFGFHLIKTKEEAHTLLHQTILTDEFGGGGTNVQKAVQQMRDKLDELINSDDKDLSMNMDDLHIIIINDGEDDCSNLQLSDLRGGKLSLFILDEFNDDLEKIAIASGGSIHREI